MPKVWMVRAGGGELADDFKNGSHISFGWDIKEDITGIEDISEIESRYRAYNPDKPGMASRIAGQINEFLNLMQQGDVVLTPTADHRWIQHGVIGEGAPYFDEEPYRNGAVHGNRRPVSWQPELIYRYDCDPVDQELMRHRPTVKLVSDDSGAFWNRYSPGSNAKSPVGTVQQVSEEDRKALELLVDQFDPFEAQDLVAELLAAMGCEGLEVSPPGPDGGVDVRAVKSDILVPEVPIFVQVKRYKWGNNIGMKAVRDLRSGITFGGRGVFVTTSRFTKGAKEVARESMFPHIALIDGPILIDLIREHWSSISEESQAKLSCVIHDRAA
ncbi:MAG: hypothetical protein F4Y69_01890 [Chloroflexi bacterium]|nr:hypothetical protein [Chloroflexota bacterium]MYF21485.1 hypothetical protein [Chloroflexota bacterium]